MIFDAYEVSCRAGAEDLLYNAIALFRPGSGFPVQKIRRNVFNLLRQYNTLCKFAQTKPCSKWAISALINRTLTIPGAPGPDSRLADYHPGICA